MAQTIYTNAAPADTITNFQTDALDPGNLMRNAFEIGLANDIAVSDIMLAWILRIPNEIDPANAAIYILDCYEKETTRIYTPKINELVKMLRELTRFDRCRLKQLSRGKRTRKLRNNNDLQQGYALN